jgi:UTP--glucose-1-phosphate uridylyltransferase
MEKEDLPPTVIETFSHYYGQLAAGESGLISDADIQPLTPDDILDAASLQSYAATGQAAMSKAVAIVLNGGLGTSMGLTKAKSLIPVKAEQTFLDIKLKQAEHRGSQLAFMNSFNTHADTQEAVLATETKLKPEFFIQNKFPKVLTDSLEPVDWPDDPNMEWNPPGHGDIYAALYASGLLDRLLNKGIEYAFIANSDNLGATLDDRLLGYFAVHNFPFMMEVAQRTPADLKGGHLARHKNGNLLLREIAQCPEDEITAFQNIRRYRYFNTNSLWVNLTYLQALFKDQGALYLPMIVNPKTVNPRLAESPAVFQIESAMGAAISLFPGATAVQVGVDRFMPVKKCPELLAIRSDCYHLTENYELILNPERQIPAPHIKLDSRYYGHLDAFNERFQWIPSLVNCQSLTIQGNCFFEKDVVISGNVTIRHDGDDPARVPAGSIIDSDLNI